jgi:hypothetical protein
MDKLERLIQDEFGNVCKSNNFIIDKDKIVFVDKIKTIVIKNPVLEISNEIDKMAENNSECIPKYANSYIASEFNPDTQHLRKSKDRKSGNFYSAYAIQFFRVF